MSDQTVVQEPAPKKRGGWPKGRKRPKRAKPVANESQQPMKAPAEFAGLTEQDCCADCCMEKCVITGMALCGHPFKGGLQPALMSKPDIVERFGRAKKALAHRKIDLTGL